MKQADLIMGILLLVLSIFFYVLTYHFSGYEIEKIPHDMGPAFLPRLLLGALVLESIVLVFQAILKKGKSDSDGKPVKLKPIFQGRPMIMLGAFLLYIYLTTLFGYNVATLAFVFLAFLFLGVRSFWVLILVPPIITLATYFLFGTVLNIYLPSGSLF
jgi:hypothetical protein